MEFICPSSCKINLTLRITGRRKDGYHDLTSLFFRLNSAERLTIRPGNDDNVNDKIMVYNAVIDGPNIVKKALDTLRSASFRIPQVSINIWKQIPPGSGVGAGSGNAAALCRWAETYTGQSVSAEAVASLGADVPFLFAEQKLSLVEGVGERISPISPVDGIKVMLVVPNWRISTVDAYSRLDDFYGVSGYPLGREEARLEALEVVAKLRKFDKIGILPSDFTPPLMEQYPMYIELFEEFNSCGALGWGISGSGSAAFALYDRTFPLQCYSKMNWIEKIIILE